MSYCPAHHPSVCRFPGNSALSSAPEGLFETRLREVVAHQRPFDLVDDRGSVAMRHLSADIKDYR